MNKDFHKKYFQTIKLYNNSDGLDDVNLFKDSADFFYVGPFAYSDKYKGQKYWVKKNDQFSVSPLPNYSNYVVLYADPDFKAKKIFVHKYGHPPIDQVSHNMSVLNCNKDWLKVLLKFKGKDYIGWTKFYCPLVTNCN